MPPARVLVTASVTPDMRAAIAQALEGAAAADFLSELAPERRADALRSADAVVAWTIGSELSAEELGMLGSAGLIQLISAGADQVPFDRLPPQVPVASNVGAYAQPMAEHVLAMALALAKRLPQGHAALARGEFDQLTVNRAIRGSVVAILGFGGIGQACAELFRALGARIHAINRSGRTDAPVEAVATLAELDSVLPTADVVVVSLPLTRQTRGLIGARELTLMKADAILVNVARGAIIDEDALYDHLRRNPRFCAGIDAWWSEPRGRGAFTPRHPFLELPNVLGSPHNSAITAGALAHAAGRAAANVARHLRREPVVGLVDPGDYVGNASPTT